MKKVLPLQKTQQKIFSVFMGKRSNAAGEKKIIRVRKVMKQNEKVIDGERILIVAIDFQSVLSELFLKSVGKKIKRAFHEIFL